MNKDMNELYLAEMEELKHIRDDPEMVHIKADDILCNLLIELGYVELVHVFKNLRKFYA